MDAKFRVAAPEQTPITLTLTAPLSEWREIMNDLSGDNGAGVEFAKKLALIIGKSAGELTAERWTTGYANGVVGEAS